jgi:hypothetical protein
MRRAAIAIGLTLVIAACGGGRLTLQEYGAQAEDLVWDVTVTIDTLDADVAAYAATATGTQTYWKERLQAREDFLAGLRNLDPPETAVDLHTVVVELFDRLNTAERALAVRVATLEPGVGAGAWWDTPEGQVARAVDQEVSTICHVAQEEFDRTEGRSVFADLTWIPAEMKEVVRVAFNCPV